MTIAAARAAGVLVQDRFLERGEASRDLAEAVTGPGVAPEECPAQVAPEWLAMLLRWISRQVPPARFDELAAELEGLESGFASWGRPRMLQTLLALLQSGPVRTLIQSDAGGATVTRAQYRTALRNARNAAVAAVPPDHWQHLAQAEAAEVLLGDRFALVSAARCAARARVEWVTDTRQAARQIVLALISAWKA